MDDFLVAIEREVVIVGDDLGLGYEETWIGAGAGFFFGEVFPALEDVGEVGLVGLRGALVVEGEAVLFHVVEPDMIGAAGIGLGEEQDGGGDAGVGLEDAGGHGDDGLELLILHQDLADLLVGIGRTEEHTIWHDDGGGRRRPCRWRRRGGW